MWPAVKSILLGVAIAGALSGCEAEPPDIPEQVRPIRTFTVTEVASGQVRRFSAVIQPSDTAQLSFQVGGNVREVRVSQGDRVATGDVLAILDQAPYRLDVRAAEADLARARAYLANMRAEFERQRTLYRQGWVARVRFDNAERDYRAASSRIDYTVARLDLARRDLANTTLAAPFAGSIAIRAVDPFVEVRAGQMVFQIDAEGGLEAEFGVPETVIGEITLGMPVQVQTPQMAEPLAALITEIGSAAGAGTVFPVRAALTDPPPLLRPGMTAEASLTLAHGATDVGFFVPLSAVAPSEQPGEGFVFVYDPKTSTVNRRAVKTAQATRGNVVAVTGIMIGERLASAGISFLADGQRVALLAPDRGS
ncbi:MAG: efflux RND transporter periplasmic adaptor subunit [Defluviicoccus sp.]